MSRRHNTGKRRGKTEKQEVDEISCNVSEKQKNLKDGKSLKRLIS